MTCNEAARLGGSERRTPLHDAGAPSFVVRERSQAGGNYGFVCVHPAGAEQRAAAPAAALDAEGVASRTSVQIVRL